MLTIGARGLARMLLAFLTIWLVAATSATAQEVPADPVNVQVVQTGAHEVTVTFEPGVDGGEVDGFFVNSLTDGIGFSTPGSPFVFSGLTEGDHTIGIYAQGVAPDYLDSNTIYTDVTVLPVAEIEFNQIPSQAFGASLDFGGYAAVTHGFGLSFTSQTPGVCDVSGQSLIYVAAGECKITASASADSGYFTPADVQQTFMIDAGAPGAPSDVTAVAGNGEATVSFTAASSDGGSTIDYYEVSSTPSGVVATGAGSPITIAGLDNGVSYVFSVRAHNSQGFGAAADSVSPVTPKGVQIISFANPGGQDFGTLPTMLATSSSGLSVTFTSGSLSVCTIDAGQVMFLTAGDCTIHADQIGDDAYLSAPRVSQTFAVNAVAPGAPTDVAAVFADGAATVSFDPPTSTGGATITGYTVTSNPGGMTASGAGSPITITSLTNGTPYTFTVTAQNGAGPGPASSPSSEGTPKGNQTITFNTSAQDFGTSPTLAATASSGLDVSYTSDTTGVCTVTPMGTLTFLTAGTCTITAAQAGDDAFLPASPVSSSFTVNAVAPDAPTSVSAAFGDHSAVITFTHPVSTGGLPILDYTVTSSPDGLTATGADQPITILGLTNGTTYTFTVTARHLEQTSSASAPSNAGTPKGGQTITFNNPGTQNFGTTPTLTATASSGLTVVFASTTSGVCTISTGGAVTFLMGGSCTINASQPGDAAYLAAGQVSQTFGVNAFVPAPPVIGSVDFGDRQATVYFSPPSSNGGATILDYTVTASPGGHSATGTGSPITVTGLDNGTTYTFTVTARNSVGTGGASAASAGGQPVGPQTISFAATAQQQVGVAASLSATASSGLPVSFSSLTTSVCTITSGGALTLLAPGACTIRASQAGGAGYAAATPVDQSFTVVGVTPTIPTLTEWAMMLMGGVLALVGATVLSRRRLALNGA